MASLGELLAIFKKLFEVLMGQGSSRVGFEP